MTADASEIVRLAERVEQATGPDKRLGAEVQVAVCGFPERAYEQQNAIRPRGTPALDRLEWAADWFGAGPTASLDAAMKLVPEGFYWMAGNRDRITPRAYVENGKSAFIGIGMAPNPARQWYEVAAATPALALTAAALRARAAQHDHEVG